MQNAHIAQPVQPNSLAVALLGPQLGKHSAPSPSAILLGAFGGGTFAIIGTAVRLPIALTVLLAIAAIVLCVRLAPTRQQQ